MRIIVYTAIWCFFYFPESIIPAREELKDAMPAATAQGQSFG
jgi:hypothetical protein